MPDDAAATDSTSAWTQISLLKGIWAKLNGGVAVAGVAQDTTLAATNTKLDAINTLSGSLTETAPATDTASSGLNGRLQRVAQRITSLIALIPASLGQKAMSASLAIVVASDQTSLNRRHRDDGALAIGGCVDQRHQRQDHAGPRLLPERQEQRGL